MEEEEAIGNMLEDFRAKIIGSVVFYAYLVDNEFDEAAIKREEEVLCMMGKLYASLLSEDERKELMDDIFGEADTVDRA